MTLYADDWGSSRLTYCIAMTLLTVTLAVTIPVEAASIVADGTSPHFLVVLRWFGYIVFGADLLYSMVRRRFAACSICHKIAGILSCLPIGPAAYHFAWPNIAAPVLATAYLLPLVRLISVYGMLREWQHARPFITGRLRLVMTLVIISLFVHWVGCGLMSVLGENLGLRLEMRYIRSVYWAVTTMTTVGYGDITPDINDPEQMLFSILIMVIGAGSFGFIIGNIATIMSNRDFARTQHLDKMQRISAFMHHHHVPGELRERVHGYHAYLWRTRQGYDESFILKELPPSIRTDMEMYLRRDIIAKAPMFKEANADMIREIVSRLNPRVALPGETVVRINEIGNSMYFIGNGNLDVLDQNGDPFASLSDGDFFGEIALLKESPRMATVRANSYCNLYELEKQDFDTVTNLFPDVGRQIRESAETRMGDRKN